MKVPFLELKPTYAELQQQFDAAYHRVMDSGWYLMGKEMEAFESEFASYIGVEHCIAVNSGLDAISLALQAHGVEPGSEVIVPAMTFIATWLAVTQIGAIPVPVDVCIETANLDVQLLEQAVTSRTQAIIPVHLYGQPADMGGIAQVAEKHGLVVLEDAAQAHGAKYRGQLCGSIGHSAAFSFYPGKNLGAFSDGGAITTNDAEVARKARALRNYGAERRYHHDMPGVNSRMDELQAAFLREKLQKLDEWNERRKQFANIYQNRLRQKPGLDLMQIAPWAESSWHLFVVRSQSRDRLQSFLQDHGVHTIIHYPIPPHRSGAYADLFEKNKSIWNLQNSEQLSAQCLSLPIGPHLTPEQVEYVCDQLLAFEP